MTDGTGAATRRLALVAGPASHPDGEHEFPAGVKLLGECLAGVPGLAVDVHDEGWPVGSAFDGVDAVVVYSDGGADHPLAEGERLDRMRSRIADGVGFGLMHWALEMPAAGGSAEVSSWIGGVYEEGFTCNPMWEPSFDSFPDHPVTRGVEPFRARDEWYFNIRFDEEISAVPPSEGERPGLRPILVATPGDEVRSGPYVWPSGPYPHIVAASGRPETLLWVVERPDGGRGFGFTGGHFHANWGLEPYRRVVLNALMWVTGVEVPDGMHAYG